jgi:phage-related minor tail protein
MCIRDRASPYLQELGFDADNLHSVMQTVEDSMESAFMSMIDGTMSAKDAFKSMAADIIRQLYRVLVVEKMVSSISGAIGNFFGATPAQGGAGRASGGAVQAGRPYVTGEHGRELFVPSSSGRVLSVAQSKAAVAGGGGTSVVQNFNFAANGDESVKQLIAQAAPRIAKMTEKGILDSRRRGGQMKAVFG